MKKLIWGLAIVVVVAVFGGRAWYLHKQATAEKNVVKIGLLTSLTGNLANEGHGTLDAAKIAEKVINSSGKYDFEIKVLTQDSKFLSKDSVEGYNKLAADGVSAIVVFGDTPTTAVTQFVNTYKIPTFAIAGRKDLLDLSPYFVRMFIPNDIMTGYYGKYVAEKMGLKKIAVLQIKTVLGQDAANAFINNAKEVGATITAHETFKESATETRAQVLKLLDSKPDAIFVIGWGAGYVNAFNYAREMGFKGPILTDFNITSNIEPLKTKDNIFYVDTSFFEETDEYHYAQKYKESHNGQDSHSFYAFVYVAATMLPEAVKKKGFDREEIMKGLKEITHFNTPLGPMELKPNGDVIVPFVVKQLQSDGTAKIVKE